MKIEFDSNFNNFNIQEKINYLEKLLFTYPLNVLIANLIYYDSDINDVINLMNKLKDTKVFKCKYKVKNIELLSLIINSLLLQNKNKELYEYLSKKDRKDLDKIINYEISKNTIFSRTKLCKNLSNKVLKNKKNLNYNDLSKKKYNKKIKNKQKSNKKMCIIIIILSFCFLIVIAMYIIIFSYNGYIYPNIYLDGKLIEKTSIEEVSKYLEEVNDILNKEITFNNSNNDYIFTYKNTGLLLNTDNIKDELNSYNELNGFSKLYKIIFANEKKFEITYKFDEDKYISFLDELREKTDTPKTNESLSIKNGVIDYQKGLDGFKLDSSNLQTLIIDSIQNNSLKVNLEGEVIQTLNKLDVINTKVSSFKTDYLESQRRSINIHQVVSYLNGTIIYPNEIFSFFKTVGPYGYSNGYVYYGEYVGSGVCQVSTTIYNAALLLNLEIKERYNHGKMVPYVDYGMDASVYSTTADFRFKNNTSYPIYIEATALNGVLTINFYSNENIIEKGYSYKPRSVKIGNLSYKTYLDTYYNNKLVKSTYLNTSYYSKGK